MLLIRWCDLTGSWLQNKEVEAATRKLLILHFILCFTNSLRKLSHISFETINSQVLFKTAVSKGFNSKESWSTWIEHRFPCPLFYLFFCTPKANAKHDTEDTLFLTDLARGLIVQRKPTSESWRVWSVRAGGFRTRGSSTKPGHRNEVIWCVMALTFWWSIRSCVELKVTYRGSNSLHTRIWSWLRDGIGLGSKNEIKQVDKTYQWKKKTMSNNFNLKKQTNDFIWCITIRPS